MARINNAAIVNMTRDIVVAEVSRTEVAPEALPGLIQAVYESLVSISLAEAGDPDAAPVAQPAAARPIPRESAIDAMGGAAPFAVASSSEEDVAGFGGARPGGSAREEQREPAVPRERSVFPDYIVCLFDGVKRKMLKRHIKTRYGMSPEAYREYWELPDDYPMTAPNYSHEKREYALQTGFGLPRMMRGAAGRVA